MDKVYDAKAVEAATLAALKDFQLETVKRVDALFAAVSAEYLSRTRLDSAKQLWPEAL